MSTVRTMLTVCLVVGASAAAQEAPWQLKSGEPQLLVDDVRIAAKSGVTRHAHACAKLPKPVLEPEKPWEAHRVYVYGTVLRDPETQQFRMWYDCFGVDLKAPARDPRLNHRPMDFNLYATSEDGVHWERPNLGLYSFNGSTDNNIVHDYHSPSVVMNPGAPNPEQRYVMLGCAKVKGKPGYVLACSPDGLHWKDAEVNPVLPGGDTCTLTYDPRTKEYLAFHKRSHEHLGKPRRLVYLSTSADLEKWSEPVLVMAPDEIDDAQTQKEGGRFSQFYNMSAFPYGGQFLGMVTHFRYSGPPKEKGPEQSGHDGPIDVQLVHSRDGRSWNRCEDRSPVIPNGPHPYDAGCILGVANYPVIVDDEMWIYYTAITTTHGGYLPKKRITIARASWRLEGFVSLDAGHEGGVVETAAFVPEGRELLVNADASNGQLAVEVLDEAGKPIHGYGRNEARVLNSDGVRLHAAWEAKHQLPAGAPIRLRFHLKNAALFSYLVH